MTPLRDFLARVQVRRDTVVGQVTGVTRDSATGRQASARVSLGEATLAVNLDAQAPELAPGDYVRLENYGASTLADWRVAAAFGARPAAGVLQFLDSTPIGAQVYAPGDILIGGTGSASPNWWFEYATGTWRRRVGPRVLGLDEASGRSAWGPPDGVHWELDPNRNTLAVKNGERALYTFDGDTGYITGWQGLGRPLGPGIRWGEIPQLDANGGAVLDAAGQPVVRYAWRVIGLNGVPVVSILSGDQANPDEAYLRIGAAGAAHYLEYTPDTGLRLSADGITVSDPVAPADALNLGFADGRYERTLTKGDLTAAAPLTVTAGRQVIGGAAAVAFEAVAANTFLAGPVSGAAAVPTIRAMVSADVPSGIITLAKLADMATASLFYRKTAGDGAPEVNTLATLKTDLGTMPPSAHNVLDSAYHGDVLTGNVARGDVLYGNATPRLARLPLGGIAGSVLLRDATDVLWSAGGLVFSDAYTATIPQTGTVAMLTAENTFTPWFPNVTAAATEVYAGFYPAILTGSGGWGGGTSQRHFLNHNNESRIRQTGVLTKCEFYVHSKPAALTTFLFEVWRKNAAGTWDLVSSQDILALMSAGSTNTITLPTPINVLVGDYVGYGYTSSSGPGSFLLHTVGRATNSTYFITDTNYTTTNYNWAAASTSTSLVPIKVKVATAPMLVTIGDSIVAGHNSNYTFAENSLTHDAPAQFVYYLNTTWGYTYQNMGIGGNSTAAVVARFTDDVLNLSPRIVIINSGVADILAAVSQATFIANWTTLLDACAANSIYAIVLAIAPWTNGTTVQMQTRDTWNAALAALVTGYVNARYVDLDTYLGTFRSGGDAGNLWDILAPYTDDGIHFTVAGCIQIANAILRETAEIRTTSTVTAALQVTQNLQVGGRTLLDGAVILRDTLQTTAVGVGVVPSTTYPLDFLQSAAASEREYFLRARVSDAGTDAFYIANGTGVDGSFMPAFAGIMNSIANKPALNFISFVTAANDAADIGGGGLLNFQIMRTSSATDPLNGSFTNVVKRRIFTIGDAVTEGVYMTVLANHNAGVGSITPAGKWHVTGLTDVQQLIVTGYSTQATSTGLVGFTRTDTAAGVSQMLTLTALGSGADGDGGSIVMLGKTSTTAAQSMGLIAWYWPTTGGATHASRFSRMVFSVYDAAGVREGLRIEASGSAPKIGFLGAGAVVQQTGHAAPTDLATTLTFCAAIRTALQNFGLITTV